MSLRLRALCVAAVCLASLAISSRASGGDYYMSNNPPLLGEQRGVVITIHGGGWRGNAGAGADIVMASYIGQFSGWGYRVYNLAHRPGRFSLIDTLAAVEAVRAAHPAQPLCVFGGSSGGHLALMAAIERPELVDCVIDQAGIPDLVKPDTAPGWTDIHRAAVRIWGRRGIREVSPMQRARELRVPVLVIAPDCDQTTSLARQEKLVRKLPSGQLLRQYGGVGYDTGHCEVGWPSLYETLATEQAFLNQHASG